MSRFVVTYRARQTDARYYFDGIEWTHDRARAAFYALPIARKIREELERKIGPGRRLEVQGREVPR